MIETLRWGVASFLMILGVVSVFLSILGVFRFKFVMNRMHCAAIIDTFGAACILISLMIAGSFDFLPKLILILALLWVGSPIASHLVGRMEISTDETASEHMSIEHKEETHGHT